MTVSFNGAWVRIGSIACLVVAVRPRIFADDYESDLIRIAFECRFGVPIILMSQDADGTARFRGRLSLVVALRRCRATDLPWRRILPGESR